MQAKILLFFPEGPGVFCAVASDGTRSLFSDLDQPRNTTDPHFDFRNECQSSLRRLGTPRVTFIFLRIRESCEGQSVGAPEGAQE